MLKLASKFAMDILPSVIATILGAYIVNHYINTRPPAADANAAAVYTAQPQKGFFEGRFEACREIGRSRQYARAGGPGEGHFGKGHYRQIGH
jgi:hypothetical protein